QGHRQRFHPRERGKEVLRAHPDFRTNTTSGPWPKRSPWLPDWLQPLGNPAALLRQPLVVQTVLPSELQQLSGECHLLLHDKFVPGLTTPLVLPEKLLLLPLAHPPWEPLKTLPLGPVPVRQPVAHFAVLFNQQADCFPCPAEFVLQLRGPFRLGGRLVRGGRWR